MVRYKRIHPIQVRSPSLPCESDQFKATFVITMSSNLVQSNKLVNYPATEDATHHIFAKGGVFMCLL